MIYSAETLWSRDFTPKTSPPKVVRRILNDCIRTNFDDSYAYVHDLIRAIHSLALLLPEPCVLSSDRQYVAIPFKHPSGLLGVDVRRVSTESSREYREAPAWVDAIAKREADAQD